MSLTKLVLPFAVLLFLISACQPDTGIEKVSLTQIKSQLKLLAVNFNEAKVSVSDSDKKVVSVRSLNSDGSLKVISSKDWCSGFYAGSLWMASELTGDLRLQNLAREFTLPLEKEKFNGDSHDMGFKMMCSFGQGYRIMHDSAYRDILIQSAKTPVSYTHLRAHETRHDIVC